MFPKEHQKQLETDGDASKERTAKVWSKGDIDCIVISESDRWIWYIGTRTGRVGRRFLIIWVNWTNCKRRVLCIHHQRLGCRSSRRGNIVSGRRGGQKLVPCLSRRGNGIRTTETKRKQINGVYQTKTNNNIVTNELRQRARIEQKREWGSMLSWSGGAISPASIWWELTNGRYSGQSRLIYSRG